MRAAIAAVLLLTGCKGFLYSQTGDVMTSYTTAHVLPAMMASDDMDMACGTGISFASFLMSFGRVTDEPRRAGLVTMLSAGFCAEAEAWEAELAQLRALRAGQAAQAQDARILEKRKHYLAAQRFQTAFNLLQGAFGEVGTEAGCPEVEPEEEILFLLGLAAGANAVIHDRSAEGAAQVPMDIPVAVARASECLDSQRWWGVPEGLRGAVWASVPGSAPEGADPWAVLQSAARAGEQAGVRLARALQVQALSAAGRAEELRQAVAAHGESIKTSPANPQWRLLDQMGTAMIQHESDKLWTQATGHRTPLGALGTFYQAQAAPELDDSLLDDLGDEEPQPEGTAEDDLPEENVPADPLPQPTAPQSALSPQEFHL